MKRKPLRCILWAFTLALLLVGCGQGVVVIDDGTAAAQQSPAVPEAIHTGSTLKTGLSITVSLEESTDATAEKNGAAQADITLVAVTVDENDVIADCIIDMVPSKISFDADGKLTTPTDTSFLSKNKLGDDYGMRKASGIGKEWNEQAAAFADYAKGKTIAQLKGIALDDSGKPADVDLASSVTISIGGFLTAIEDAVGKAQPLGAGAGDKLHLTSITTMENSRDAGEQDGLAQIDANVAVITLRDDRITSCRIDSVQIHVNFDAAGTITTDLTAPMPTKAGN